MAVPTLSQLLATPTAQTVLAQVIASLQGNGLPTTDWASGSVLRTLSQALADGLNDFVSGLVPTVAGSGFIDSATGTDPLPNGQPSPGDWLSLLAQQMYGVTRIPAQGSTGSVVLTCASGQGPYTIAVGQLWISDTNGNLYTNTTGGTVTSSAPLTVLVQSSGIGAAYNANAGTLTTLVTPLPGLSVNNPAPAFTQPILSGAGTGTVTLAATGTVVPTNVQIVITQTGAPGTATFSYTVGSNASVAGNPITSSGMTFAIPGTGVTAIFTGSTINSWVVNDVWSWSQPGSWLIQQGNDAESDTSLRQRCRARWPSLGSAPTLAVYTAWAKAASGSVSRVNAIPDPATPGLVDVYVAGPGGQLSGSVTAQVLTYIQQRVGLTERVAVLAATPNWVQVSGNATVKAAYLAQAQAQSLINLANLINNLPFNAILYGSEIIEAVMSSSPGMIDFSGMAFGTSTTGPASGYSGAWGANTGFGPSGSAGGAWVFGQSLINWNAV